MKRSAALLLALAVSGCAADADPGGAREIPVIVPLSGEDASRGDAVTRAAAIMNDLLAGNGASAGAPHFLVRDANLTGADLADLVREHESSPVFITGGCKETQRVAERLSGRPHFIISLFCDRVEERAGIEQQDRDNSIYWFGPLQVSFMRGLAAFVREKVMLMFSNGIPAYDFLHLVVAGAHGEGYPDAVEAFNDLGRYGIPVAVSRVPACDVEDLRDYTATIKAVDAEMTGAANERPPRRGLVFLLMPWLSTTEWMRQAEIVLGQSRFAAARTDWIAPLDYQVDDPQVSLSPFSVDGLMVMTQQNSTSVRGVSALDDAMLKRYGIHGRSLVTRVAVDAFAAVALALARSPSGPDAARESFLSVTDKKPGDLPADFSDLTQALSSAAAGAGVNYDGVFSRLDEFDRFGQLSREIKTALRRLVPSGDLPVIVKQDEIFIDPLEGQDVSIAHLISRGCVTAEPTVDSDPWAPDRFQYAYDRDPTTGILPYDRETPHAGVILHFARPARLTGVYFQHFRTFNDQSTLPTDNRVLWWRAPMPPGFDHRASAPDGEAALVATPKGAWNGVDWSFQANELQTLVLLADYGLTNAAELGALFSDLHLFLDPASAAALCP